MDKFIKNYQIMSRKNFIEYLFYIFQKDYYDLDYQFDILITCCIISDNFVNSNKKNNFKLINNLEFQNNFQLDFVILNIFENPCKRIYNKFLAKTILNLIHNIHTDINYEYYPNSINVYKYTKKLEWEICIDNNFYIPNNNFITKCFKLLNTELLLNFDFIKFCKKICLNKKLLYSNNLTLLIAILILSKKHKLNLNIDNKEYDNNIDYNKEITLFDKFIKYLQLENICYEF